MARMDFINYENDCDVHLHNSEGVTDPAPNWATQALQKWGVLLPTAK